MFASLGPNCDQGYFYDSVSTKKCVTCNSDCLACSTSDTSFIIFLI